MMTALQLRWAWRAWRRDWRHRESRVIALALVVAVAAMTSVGFFVDRVERSMERQAASILGADLAVTSSQPLDPSFLAAAERLQLAQSGYVQFPSLVLANEATALTQVKAVSAGYPLRGQLLLQDGLDAEARPATGVPAQGEVWVQARLLGQLGLRVGDRLQLGDASLRIGAIIALEPDQGASFIQLAPRVMLAEADLAATGLISPASRVQYTALFAGTPQAVEDLRRQLEAEGGPAIGVRDTRNARPELETALERAERFLGLAALVSTLLAGIAIAVAARGLAEREAESVAVARCLGARRRDLLSVFVLRLMLIAVFSGLVGAAIGYLVQSGIAALLSEWFVGELPAPGPAPVIQGLLLGVIALCGFALPAVLQAANVSPLAVLRRDLGFVPPSAVSVAVAGLVAVGLLLWWQSEDPRLAGLMFAGILLTMGALVALAALLVRLLRRLPHGRGMAWRFGLAAVGRRGAVSVTQISALGLGLMVMLLLAFVRVDLLSAWERSLPEAAPNQFLINIQVDEVAALREFFARQGQPVPEFYPMVRGRLLAINDRPVASEDYVESRAQRLVAREFNLSWLDRLQADNRVVAGEWWGDAGQGKPWFSVEDGIAETLGIGLGDTLTYGIAGEEITGEVVSLREVDWDSFRVNFFVVAPSGMLDDFPATYISSFYLPPGERELPVALVREFPSVTVLDVRAIMNQVRSIMERASLAVELVFLFTVAAGVLVLYATIQASRHQRERESAILRTLGARRRQLALAYGIEFAVTGLLAGLLAALAAQLVGLVLATQVFDLPYEASPWIWPIALIAGVIGVSVAGVGGLRGALRVSPVRVLQGG